jgi:hypothetical protein
MKQITASNDRDNTRSGKRGLDEMRSIPVEGGRGGLARGFRKVGQEAGLGSGFKKVGQETAAGAGSGFKKVGVAVEGALSGFKKVGVTTSSPKPSAFKKVAVVAEGSGTGSMAFMKSGNESIPPTVVPVEPAGSPAKVDNGPLEEEIKAPATGLTSDDKVDSMLQPDVDAMDTDETDVKKGVDVAMGEDDEEEEEEVVTWEEYDFLKPTGCDHANCPGCKTIGVLDEGWVVVKPTNDGMVI